LEKNHNNYSVNTIYVIKQDFGKNTELNMPSKFIDEYTEMIKF